MAGVGATRSEEPCLPFETLPSPVIVDKNDDVVEDMGGLADNSGVVLGLGKSGVKVVFVWGCDWISGRTGFDGPRRNRAWPVRLRMEMTRLNLETVKSVISRQSRGWGVWGA